MKNYFTSFVMLLGAWTLTICAYSAGHTIYIYADQGASRESLLHTQSTFHHLRPHDPIKLIDAPAIIGGDWIPDAAALVMPGGADLPYAKLLNGKGNTQIKKFVQAGGVYIGLCAGAYYAAANIEFDKHGPLEVVGKRELAFFKGSAIGPILATYDYQSQSGSRAANITTVFQQIPVATVFYNGGGYFKHADALPHTSVLARYQNNLPAIVFIKYGKGKVLLSGVHFEYDPALLDKKDVYLAKIVPPLQRGNHQRQQLAARLLNKINI